MKKLLLMLLAAGCLTVGACGDDDDPVVEPTPDPNSGEQNPDPENPDPNNGEEPEEEKPVDPRLAMYQLNPLKSYIDRSAHPIFKLSGAIEAWDFNSQAKLRDTLALHFDEIVAGNSMKYSGCVDRNGNMNFNTVKDFCAKAKAVGLTIYGHTLAWHSQQQPNYLNSLLYETKVIEQEAGVVETEESLYEVDFTKFKDTKGHTISSNEGTVKDAYGNEYAPDSQVDYPFYAMGYVPTMTDEGLESKSDGWYQYFVMARVSVKPDPVNDYRLKISVKSEGNVSFQCVARWSWSEDPVTFEVKFNKSDDFKDYVFDFDGIAGDGFELIFQPPAGTTFVIKNLEICQVFGKAKTMLVPLSAEKKREALTNAMDQWIGGVMEATDGFVKGWDVVNEAISGGGDDGEGNYTLQHNNSHNTDPTSVQNGLFFWQDDMGDLEYVRTAVACARKHFKGNPDDLKLFINDYNLESDWDGNKKLKSLINWIKKWESDGVTKIDGIGTQMHITCYSNNGTNESKKRHIRTMFELMAATGKLVRVSELDMGYNRNGTTLATGQLTEAEHQKMADLYKFIIDSYFELVPPEQQYGICQWCLTDAGGQLGTGWRGGEPVGIWTQNYSKRKVVYKGWVDALAGNK